MYVALKCLVRSGGLNAIDTAINYRCQKSERIVGAALRTLFDEDLYKLDVSLYKQRKDAAIGGNQINLKKFWDFTDNKNEKIDLADDNFNS